MRTTLIVLAGLVAVVAAAVAVLLLVFDLNDYKSEIEARLEAATGRQVTVGGDISFALVPEIALSIENVTVAGAPSGSGAPFLQLPRVLASVALGPLISLEVAIQRVRLVRPAIVLESGGDGPASWEIAGGGDGDSGGGAAAMSISIARVDLEQARIEWRDGARRLAFERIDLRLDAGGRDGPFDLRASFLHAGHPWRLDAEIGRISRPQLAVNALLASGEEASVKIAGAVTLAAGAAAFAGQVEAEAAHAGLPLALAGVAAGADAGPPLAADASLSLSAAGVALSDLALRLGESQATGTASFAPRQGGTLALAFNRLDLDALLPLLAAAAGDGNDDGGQSAATLPPDLRLHAELSADAVIWRGAPLRRAHLDLALADGSWRLERAEALLPGGTAVAATGQIAMEDGQPVLRGPLRASSDNLRATLAWLGLDPAGVPRDRLRRFALTARLAASPGALAAREIELALDSSRLTGAASIAFGSVPAVAATLAVDRVNLDAYLPPAGDGETTGGAAAFTAPPLDLALDGRIEALTWRGLALGGVTAAGSWRDGRLELERLGADDIAGASLRLAGSLDTDTGQVALTLAGEADDAAGLLRLAGAGAGLAGARLGKVEMEGELHGEGGRFALRQRLASALGTAELAGTLAHPLTAPAFDGRLEVKGASTRALAAAFALTLPGAGDSAFAVAADIAADTARLAFDGTAEALGVGVQASGKLEGLDRAGGFDLELRADHRELARLLADLGAGGDSALGAAALKLSAAGNGERIDAVLAPSRLGPAALEGTLAAAFDGPRPFIEARLQSGELALDPFLAALRSPGADGKGDGENGGAARREDGTIRLDALRAVDGRLELAARRLSLDALALQDVSAAAVIADGRLTLERFEGNLFGGRMAATGSAEAGAPQRFAATLALEDADMAQIAAMAAASEAVGGRLSLAAELASEGRTHSAIVQALAGSGNIALREGWLEGFDLAAIGERLEGLDDPIAIAELLAQATAGGRTPIDEIRASFEIAGGVLRSQDVTARLAGGEGEAQAAIDLPRRHIDLQGSARLTASDDLPAFPIAIAGPFAEPEFALDTRPLQGFLVERAAGAVLGTMGGDQLEATGALLEAVAGAASGDEDADPAAAAGAAIESLPGAEPLAEGAGTLLDLLSGGTGAAPENGANGGGSSSLLDLLSGANGSGGE